MPPRKYTDEQEKQILALYKQGLNAPKIAEMFGTYRQLISRIIHRQNGTIRPHSEAVRQYAINEYAFDKLDEPTIYWLGFLYADGHVSSKQSRLYVHLAKKDSIHLEALQKFMGTKIPIYETETQVRFAPSHPHLAKRLLSLGIVTNRLKFNRVLKHIPHPLLRHWIRGLFDGDGHAGDYVPSGPIMSWCGNEPLMLWLRNFLSEAIGTNPNLKVSHNTKAKHCYYLNFTGRQQCIRIGNWMYQDATICLERKRTIIESFKVYKPGRYAKSRRVSG